MSWIGDEDLGTWKAWREYSNDMETWTRDVMYPEAHRYYRDVLDDNGRRSVGQIVDTANK